MDEDIVRLGKVSIDRAKQVVVELLRDKSRFSVETVVAVRLPSTLPEASSSFFQQVSSVRAVYGDMSIEAASIAPLVVQGASYWVIGSDTEHVVLLVDQSGQVFEWDDPVLDGPVAPSIWHYVLWTANILYDVPLS